MTEASTPRPSPTVPAAEAVGESLDQRVGRLVAAMGNAGFSAADRAALKRMTVGVAPPLAFYRLWLRTLDDDIPHAALTPAWMVIVSGLAIASSVAHRPDRGFGQALAESGWNEARLERLLSAGDESSTLKLASDALRYLAAKGEGFDWGQVARLLLARTDASQDAIHRRIATDYYRYQPRPDAKE